MESGININIEESVMDEAEDLVTPEDDDVTDVIINNGIFPTPVSAGVDFLNFNGFTEAFSRRGSLRSSVTSIDSGSGSKDRYEFILSDIPDLKVDLLDYVRGLAQNFRRSHQLREIINENTWFKENPNWATSDTGDTLLHIAALLAEMKLVSVICHYFPLLDINATNNDGNTALHFSADNLSATNITDTLLKHGSKMIRNEKGLDPLQVAAYRCNLNCLEIMLMKNYPEAEINSLILTRKNETLLHLACRGTRARVLDNQDETRDKLESSYYEETVKKLRKNAKKRN